jgi:hypothetical protein
MKAKNKYVHRSRISKANFYKPSIKKIARWKPTPNALGVG